MSLSSLLSITALVLLARVSIVTFACTEHSDVLFMDAIGVYVKVESPLKCKQRCSNDERCYTYGFTSGACFLIQRTGFYVQPFLGKDGESDLVSGQCKVECPRVKRDSCTQFPGIEFRGFHGGSSAKGVSTLEECQKRCLAESSCFTYSFHMTKSTCFLIEHEFSVVHSKSTEVVSGQCKKINLCF